MTSGPIDTVLGIDTPEHLAFRVRIAGPARRMLAWVVDLIIRVLIVWFVAMLLGLVFASVSAAGVGQGLILILIFVMEWFYYVFFEVVTGGRSPGKLWLKLRVVRTNGLPITWRESLLRNLLRSADLMIIPPNAAFPLGVLLMAFDPKFRRGGDYVAGTIVVVEESSAVSKPKTLAPDPTLVAELPAVLPMDRSDLEALELFVHRQHMSDARRDELAEIVAPEYAARLSLPTPKHPSGFLAALWARAQDPKRRRA